MKVKELCEELLYMRSCGYGEFEIKIETADERTITLAPGFWDTVIPTEIVYMSEEE